MPAINTVTRNDEIWRKILNSVAGKYDCGVTFTMQAGHLGYEGDRHCAEEIVRETLALFVGVK